MGIGPGTSFTSVASAGPILFACSVNNAATISRTFDSLKGPRDTRKVAKFLERLLVLNRFGRECTGRDLGQTAAFRSYVRCIRSYDEDVTGGATRGSSAVHDFGFLWAVNPKNGPGRPVLNRTEDGGREVLPNALPLPRKSRSKQDEPRAIRIGYVIEIEGTTRNRTKHPQPIFSIGCIATSLPFTFNC